MNKSDWSYLMVSVFFVIGFLGFMVSAAGILVPVWYGAITIGILLFIFRIARGDD